METENNLKKIKSRQLGRCIEQLQLVKTPQIVIDAVEKYFNYFYLDALDLVSSQEKQGKLGNYDRSNNK